MNGRRYKAFWQEWRSTAPRSFTVCAVCAAGCLACLLISLGALLLRGTDAAVAALAVGIVLAVMSAALALPRWSDWKQRRK